MIDNDDAEQEWGLPSIGITPEILFNPLFSNTEKVLYGFIRNLSAQPRGCFATNVYLGKLVGMVKHPISRAISKLNSAKYIKITEEVYKGKKQRVIRINHDANHIYKPLISQVLKKWKNCEDWINDPEIIKLAEKLSGYTTELTSVDSAINEGILQNQPALTQQSTNEEDKKDEIKEDSKDSFSLEKDNTSFQDENISSVNTLEASNDIPKKTNRPLKNIMNISAPESSVQIISFWGNLGFTNHRPGTKTYNLIINSIRKLNNGTFFNDTSLTQYFDTKFSDDQIKETIQKFSLAAFNLDYNPPPSEYKDYLKKVSFLNFLYNPKANKEKSLFIKFYEKIPELAKESNRTRKDAFPDLTNTLKKVYTQKILGGVQIDDWGNVHENKFILASQLLNDFFAKNRSKISNHFLSRGNLDKCEYLIDSIIQDIGENNLGRISPSWLCSPETLNRRLPAYLSMQNIIFR